MGHVGRDAQRETTAAVAKNKINTLDITLSANRPPHHRASDIASAATALTTPRPPPPSDRFDQLTLFLTRSLQGTQEAKNHPGLFDDSMVEFVVSLFRTQYDGE